MARSPQSYQKRQRELRKKERKAEKLAVRHGKSSDSDEEPTEGPDEDALLEEFRQLNEKFAAGDVEEDDFEYRKAEIFAQLGLGEAPEPRGSIRIGRLTPTILMTTPGWSGGCRRFRVLFSECCSSRRGQARVAVSQNPVPADAVRPVQLPGSAVSTSSGGRWIGV